MHRSDWNGVFAFDAMEFSLRDQNAALQNARNHRNVKYQTGRSSGLAVLRPINSLPLVHSVIRILNDTLKHVQQLRRELKTSVHRGAHLSVLHLINNKSNCR